MSPLKLHQTQTMQKAQGIIIPHKVAVSLIDREKENKLTYIALNRVTKFSNLRIKDTKGVSKNRLCKKFANILKQKNIN